jgi:CRISPR-associated protein Cmr4
MAESSEKRLLLIHAETPLHPGAGSALGVVDLPVARERHTQWPLIPGSSLKGVLRAACTDKAAQAVVFGPDTKNASDHAGALSITDARILAFPVRSLRGLFAWTTCPAALERLVRDARLAGGGDDPIAKTAKALLDKARSLGDGNALVSSASLTVELKGAQQANPTNMVLEEFDYVASVSAEASAFGAAVDHALGGNGELRLATHLAVLSDNAFTHGVRFATEVMARIGIDYETKTVSKGALFYEEFLPAGTIFYSAVIAEASRATDKKYEGAGVASAAEVLRTLEGVLGAGVHQIGGDATIGKGLCTLKLAGGK